MLLCLGGMTQTSEALKALSPDKFERLASAVLRRAEPAYQRLIDTGTNTDGQTVKSPLDGICVSPDSHPLYFVVFQYTMTRLPRLRTKWLHQQTPDGRGSKTPDGDIVKAIRWIEEQRRTDPGTRARLVLVCNEGPDAMLIADASQACARHDIELDIWESSRLGYFLENDADGQWLRKQHLGIAQERLSINLLRELALRSCDLYARYEHLESTDPWIDRALDEDLRHREGVTLLVAGSGQGKTTASYKLLRCHVDAGGIGLWVEPRFLEEASTCEMAVEAALRSLYPSLEMGSGAKAFELADEAGLLLLIDDVNRTLQPSDLVRRVVSWNRTGCRILCPVWPQVLDPLLERFRDTLQPLCLHSGGFSTEEGAAAVERRAHLTGRILTAVEAAEIADDLANDPLLIDLWAGGAQSGFVKMAGTPVSESAIDEFLQRRLQSLASSPAHLLPAAESWETLLDLARRMLLDRREVPSWREVENWFRGEPQRLGALRRLIDDRVICRLGGEASSSQLLFRHDRVRDHLLARALRGWMEEGTISGPLLAEPHYAEILGQALAAARLEPSWADRVAEQNPLALACALRLFRIPETPFQEAIVSSLRRWLEREVAGERCGPALRSAVLWEFRRTDSPLVMELSAAFRAPSFDLWHARMRNGDVEAGAQLCAQMGAGDHVRWVGYLARHVADRLGKTYLDDLVEFLERPDLPDETIAGALILCGWLAELILLKGIEAAWERIRPTPDPYFLASFVWATARCSKGVLAPTLESMVKAWKAFSNESSDASGLPDRIQVGEVLRRSFSLTPPDDEVVRFLTAKADGEDLSWAMVVALGEMNHPRAVAFIANYVARVDREAKAAGKNIGAGPWMITRYWDPKQSPYSRRLSDACLSRLRDLWEPADNDQFLRRQAFSLWLTRAGRQDLATLQSIGPDSTLYRQALRERIWLGDVAAASGLIEMLKLEGYPDYWWRDCEKIWCEELKSELDNYLEGLSIRPYRRDGS